MQIKKEAVKAEIDRAAVRVFLQKGFRRASMKDIARIAGTSVSNMYNYYSGKLVLFSALVQPVLGSIHRLLDSLIEQEEGLALTEKDSRQEFENLLIGTLLEFLSLRRESLILLFDKSQGTPFESSRDEMIRFVEEHFIDSLPQQRRTGEILLLMHILASNFMEGLLEIVRHIGDDEERSIVLRGLVQYHINGIYPFFEEV